MDTARVLVTGATGFLGGALCQRLHRLGFSVTATGRDAARGAALGGGIRFVAADLADGDAAAALCAGQDYVVHCAALASPWGRYQDFHRANVVATRNIASASRRAGVRRMVHVSSPSIYMDHRDRVSVREDEPLPETPLSFYAATKRLAEDEIDRAHGDGLPVITIRPQGIFGPGDRVIFPRLIRVARRGWFPVIGHGRNLIDITYIDNVVDALLLCLSSPPASLGRKYNISNGDPISNYELLDRVFTAVGVRYRRVRVPFGFAYRAAGALEAVDRALPGEREPTLTRYAVCVLGKSRTLDLSAARTDLGYQPRVGIADGIDRFVTWWKEQDHVAG